MPEAYSPCPCGSGKKFKWCCQPIHGVIEQALRLEQEGQHEAALRAMEAVTRDHPSNPEAYGRLAQMHFAADRVDEAEKALQQALAINPDYPFGHLLRAQFRLYEGEIPGGLLLLRKAAALYDPEAKEVLSYVFGLIFENEMRLHHPVAARAALAMAYKAHPVNELREGIEKVFGAGNPNLPLAARMEYQLLPLPAEATPERRAAWDKALAQAATGKLGDVVAAFNQLTRGDATNAPAWYNLALAQAWSGDNLAAIDALERYVDLENDEARAGAAWTLAEVLKCAPGLEDRADLVEHSVIFKLNDPQTFINNLEKLAKEEIVGNLAVTEDRATLTGTILEKPPPALTLELEAKQPTRVAALFLMTGDLLRIWNQDQEMLQRGIARVRPYLGRIGQEFPERRPALFVDQFGESIIFFPKEYSPEARASRLRENLEQFFEGTWLHRSRKSLDNTPPIDAAGLPRYRKKLLGIISFLEQCAALSKIPYDFDRLRRKLNLIEKGPAPAGQPLDLTAMSTAELSALDRTTLAEDQLEQAYQSALKLDARDLASQFAQTLVRRPGRADKPDRFPWYNFLISQSLNQGEGDAALEWVNDGERDDCENNEGRRRNDYELRRGQVLAKRGEFGQAAATFDRLVQRAPGELRYYGAAAESLLSARQGPAAQAFADKGLAEARQQNNRDQEGYFQELAAAAKKQS